MILILNKLSSFKVTDNEKKIRNNFFLSQDARLISLARGTANEQHLSQEVRLTSNISRKK